MIEEHGNYEHLYSRLLFGSVMMGNNQHACQVLKLFNVKKAHGTPVLFLPSTSVCSRVSYLSRLLDGSFMNDVVFHRGPRSLYVGHSACGIACLDHVYHGPYRKDAGKSVCDSTRTLY